MSDQLYTNINLSASVLQQGSAEASDTAVSLGVAASDGTLQSVTVNSDDDESGITFTVQVAGADVSAATAGPNAASIQIPIDNGGASVSAGDLITIALSGAGATGNISATAVLS